MANNDSLMASALKALRSEPRIGPHFKPYLDSDDDGNLTIDGDVESVAAKRLALERLAAFPQVTAIVDRLHVRPATPMGDAEIREHLRNAFVQEPSFLGFRIRERRYEVFELVRDGLEGVGGRLDIEVDEGIVTLNGAVPSLASKRLAGVLAWWVPGSRDVINGIAVEPPEEDAPIRIEEAVRIALDKDRLVDAGQILVGVRQATVRLTGLVQTDTQRDAAENDAWYVFGVDMVINEIDVRA